MAEQEDLHTFPVGERLKSKKLIGELFQKGSSFSFYPYRILYRVQPEEVAAPRQLLISIPRRRFKRAVDRNYLKRLIREVWRQRKGTLRQNGLPITVAIIYIGKDKMPYRELDDKLKAALKRLSKQLLQRSST